MNNLCTCNCCSRDYTQLRIYFLNKGISTALLSEALTK